jgi:uncharacterized YigZ family protein
MQKIEKYRSIVNFNESTLKEKSSVFIAQAYPVENEGEAQATLEKIKKKYYDATHHCYAYKLLGDQIKYSDSGEPSGTAGIRILNAINHFNLSKILVVVIRYFGGTKLGVGPLGKAYYNSVLQTLERSHIVEKIGYKKIIIDADLKQINNVFHLLEEFKGKINNSEYSDYVKFECLVPLEKIEQFISNLKELSKGEIKIKIDENSVFI